MSFFGKLLKVVKGVWTIEALFDKVIYTLGVLAVFRLGLHIPLAGINLDSLSVFKDVFSSSTGFLANVNMMAGGTLTKCSVLSLGISPYISASILMQMLTISIPFLEALSKEGSSGRAVISRYTRYLAVFLSVFHAYFFASSLQGSGLGTGINLVLDPGFWFKLKVTFALVVGSAFVMWLGEQISRFGIGQGSSVIIFAGIVNDLPLRIATMISNFLDGDLMFFTLWGTAFIITALSLCVIFLEKAERRVQAFYAKKVSNRFGGSIMNSSQFIPFKINSAGVMPVILANSVLGWIIGGITSLARNFSWASSLEFAFIPGSFWYGVLTLLLIMWFNFAYISVIFNPVDIAENLKKSNGFLPNLRPGAQTAEYFDYLLTRIGFPGALYIAFLAIAPGIISYFFSLPYFSGLSLLIAVGVALDVLSQGETYFIEKKYSSSIGF